MESIGGSVCWVCSKAFCSTKRNIAVDVLKLLKFLYRKINCSGLRNIQICENCLENVQNAYNFKMLYVEKNTLNVALKIEHIDPGISCICQICKEIIKKSSSVPTTKVLKLIDYLVDEMPLRVEVTEDSRICTSCHKSIVGFHYVVKLLSNFVENNEHKCNVKIQIEPSTDLNKIEIKEEPSMEYENIANEYLMVKTEPLEMESTKHNIKTEVKLIYDDFIIKNEEMDIKSECEENDSVEQMRKVIQEHDKINPWNVASKHFTVDHKNEKTSRTINIYKTSNFTCNVCDYNTKYKSSLKRHMLKHKNVDEIEMFACDVCDYKTKYESSLKIHMLQHESVDKIKMFMCNICNYKAKQNGDLKKHMLTHKSVDEIEMFACDVCEYKAKRKGHLKMHMLIHKSVDEIEIFSCDVCDYKTKYKSSLKIHMLQHKSVDKIEMYSCEICDYKAKLKGQLTRHMMLKHKSDDEIEMFACNVCEYKSQQKGNIKKHELKHKSVDEIEMFACNVCDYKTRLKGDLKKHMLKHKNVDEIEMFACDVCEYKTKYKSNLTTHMIQHKSVDKIVMFSCEICDYKAKLKGYLTKHMMLQHKHVDEIETFRCDICSYKTKYKSSLRRHILVHKNVVQYSHVRIEELERNIKKP